MFREYRTLNALLRGEVVDIGAGILVKRAEGEIGPGDLYVAERNQGPKLLTARRINVEEGWIIPTDFREYSYDVGECVKVREA